MLHRKPVHIEQHTERHRVSSAHSYFWQQRFGENQWELSGIIKCEWMIMDRLSGSERMSCNNDFLNRRNSDSPFCIQRFCDLLEPVIIVLILLEFLTKIILILKV